LGLRIAIDDQCFNHAPLFYVIFLNLILLLMKFSILTTPFIPISFM